MKENNFSCVNEEELVEINGGVIDPLIIVTVSCCVANIIHATARLVSACKK